MPIGSTNNEIVVGFTNKKFTSKSKHNLFICIAFRNK